MELLYRKLKTCLFETKAVCISRLKFFISKRKILFLTLCISPFVLLLLQIYPSWRISKTDSAPLIIPESNEPLVYKCCIQTNNSIRTNVYFLKTHKTGSTTVQSVLLRFALLHSLDIMHVIYESYYMPFTDFSIYSDTWTPNKKYHVMAHHMRYDSKLKAYQHPDTSMVTLLRNPARLFQSIYNYYRMDLTMGKTFQQFLNASKKPEHLWSGDSAVAYRGYNQMSVDLGFDLRQSKNATAIVEFIAKIDREFDLIMITECMEESMILLANLMGWPLEYVAFIELNARLPESDSYSLLPQDEINLNELNQIDVVLYQHFLRKFRECVQQYGEHKMNDQVQQLKKINERFKSRCVADEVVALNIGKVEMLDYLPKNQSDMECFYSIQIPPKLMQMARNIQSKKSSLVFGLIG